MLKCSTVPCLVCHTPRPPLTRELRESLVSAVEEELRLLCRIIIVLQHGIYKWVIFGPIIFTDFFSNLMDHVDLVCGGLPLLAAEVRHPGVGGHHHLLLLALVQRDQDPPEKIVVNIIQQGAH